MTNVFDIPMRFIEYSIYQGIQAHKGEITKYEGDLKNMYFVGRTLCLDTKDEFGNVDVITICHGNEDFGLFSGGTRRLLSLKALRKMEALMFLCNVSYEPKEILL